MWRWFASDCTPSHHAVRASCVQLLPLIDMYCKYVLQEDNTNLWGLMVRFDCEADLASHDLGCSMLAMLRDDAEGRPEIMRPRVLMIAAVSPFEAIRTTLAAMDVALQTMRPHVHLDLEITCLGSPADHSCSNLAPLSVCSRAGVCPNFVNGKFSSSKTSCLFGRCVDCRTPPPACSHQCLCGPLVFCGSFHFVCTPPLYGVAACATPLSHPVSW